MRMQGQEIFISSTVAAWHPRTMFLLRVHGICRICPRIPSIGCFQLENQLYFSLPAPEGGYVQRIAIFNLSRVSTSGAMGTAARSSEARLARPSRVFMRGSARGQLSDKALLHPSIACHCIPFGVEIALQ
jgi:hypothetical protein